MIGINHLHDILIGEPQAPVWRASGVGLKGCIRRPCAVEYVEGVDLHVSLGTIPPLPQFRIWNSNEATLCVKPKSIIVIRNQSVQAVARQTILAGQGPQGSIPPFSKSR